MKALLKTFSLSTALPLFALLSACSGGGGGGGLASTPTPPPASYTKIVDMTGDRTFQTGGIQYNTPPGGGFSNTTSFAFGSGITVAYTAASDSYKLTAPDGSTVTFDPSNAQTPPAGSNSQLWVKTVGTTRDQLLLSVPTISGVPLSYTLIGSWGHFDTTNVTPGLIRLAVGGAPTIASDMPKTGTATYSTSVGGAAFANGVTPSYTLTGNSTSTFSANFGAGTISNALTLAGAQGSGPVTNFGTFTGTGSIASTGPGFTGTLTGTGATGVYSGAFFGPQALEMGYEWSLNGGTFTAVGTVTGLKN